eukprot:4277519-Amphidinium_carterae.1
MLITAVPQMFGVHDAYASILNQVLRRAEARGQFCQAGHVLLWQQYCWSLGYQDNSTVPITDDLSRPSSLSCQSLHKDGDLHAQPSHNVLTACR